jgi:hypothetical protein
MKGDSTMGKLYSPNLELKPRVAMEAISDHKLREIILDLPKGALRKQSQQ